MDNFTVRECKDKESCFIEDKIVEYNLSIVPLQQETDFIWINRVVENTNGTIIAGILSKMYCWNCLYIDVLWVQDVYRRDGLGSRLLKEVEDIARDKGCSLIHLDTFDFQAKDFYIKHGYEVFGTLEDCPKGHKRYFMKKAFI